MILLLEGKCLYKLFRIVHRKSALLPYLFNHLLISAQTYLFYTLDYNGILLYFVAQVIPDLDIGSSLSWFLCPLTSSPSLSCVCCVSFLFLLLALSSLWHYKMLQAHPYMSYSILMRKHKKKRSPRVRKGTYYLFQCQLAPHWFTHLFKNLDITPTMYQELFQAQVIQQKTRQIWLYSQEAYILV